MRIRSHRCKTELYVLQNVNGQHCLEHDPLASCHLSSIISTVCIRPCLHSTFLCRLIHVVINFIFLTYIISTLEFNAGARLSLFRGKQRKEKVFAYMIFFYFSYAEGKANFQP